MKNDWYFEYTLIHLTTEIIIILFAADPLFRCRRIRKSEVEIKDFAKQFYYVDTLLHQSESGVAMYRYII